jgi:hypothetical protein
MKRTTLAVLGLLVVCAAALGARGQSNSLPLGTPTLSDGLLVACSSITVPNHAMFGTGMTCGRMIISCPGVSTLGVTYGSYVPANPKGTIVLMAGAGGTMPAGLAGEETSYANDYEAMGYAVVQLEWDSAWEDATNGSGGSILAAACRPATFLNWVNNNGILHPQKAMCAQGSSGGSAAVAYSLAWYGASSYLVNAELLSGPVLSEIDQGCTYPNALNMSICAPGQYGCTPKTVPWSDNVIYVTGDNGAVSNWSGLPNCATSLVNPADYPTWAAMSIVDGTSGSVTPTFNYPATSMHGWVCQSYQMDTCGTSSCPNNSASQGNYYYEQFSSLQTPKSFKLTGVQACDMAEGVNQGTDPDTGGAVVTSVENDTKTFCAAAN